MKINLKKTSNLIYLQIYFVCFVRFFIYDLGFPSIIYYFTDVINILIFLCSCKKIAKEKTLSKFKTVLFLMFLGSILSCIINVVSITSYVWGFRNIYRFFIYFMGCVVLLEKDDYKKIINILKKVLIINFILVLYQYFILHNFQDLINGTFGSTFGGNGYMNILLCIVIIDVIHDFMKGKIKTNNFIYYSIIALGIAALSELKIFFFEYAIVYVFFLATLKKNFKIIFITIIVFLLLQFVINIFGSIYGFENIFSIDGIIDYAVEGSYSSTMELNRMSAVETLDKMFMDSAGKKILGLGLGNTDTSSLDIFNSAFYRVYGERLKYTWFTDAIVFLENGYLGLTLYCIFIVLMCVKVKNKEQKYINIIFVILSIILIIYNNSLKVESAYLWYACMALAFTKENKKVEKEESEINEEMWHSNAMGRQFWE